MLFMPRGAYVILLEPQDLPSKGSDRKGKVPLYRAEAVEREREVMRAVRGLARAAGLHLAVVACPVELADGEGAGAAPRLVCGTQLLADAVAWAASDVYTWRNLPGPGGNPTALNLADSIPGSGLATKEAVGGVQTVAGVREHAGELGQGPLPALPAMAQWSLVPRWGMR